VLLYLDIAHHRQVPVVHKLELNRLWPLWVPDSAGASHSPHARSFPFESLTEFPFLSFSVLLFFHLCSFYLFTASSYPYPPSFVLSLADCPFASIATCPKHSHPTCTCFTSLSFSFSFILRFLPPVLHDSTIPVLYPQRHPYVFKLSGTLPTSIEPSSCLLFSSQCEHSCACPFPLRFRFSPTFTVRQWGLPRFLSGSVETSFLTWVSKCPSFQTSLMSSII
jgi:hypothetical protein